MPKPDTDGVGRSSVGDPMPNENQTINQIREQGIAGHSLLNLRQQGFRIADEEIANVFPIPEF
jgi:hypothetical protein